MEELGYAAIAITSVIILLGGGLFFLLGYTAKQVMQESVFTTTGFSMKTYWDFYDKICKNKI